MKTLKFILMAFLPLMLLTYSGCNKTDDPAPTPEDPFAKYTYIGEMEAIGAGLTVKLYADEELFVGYNNLLVAVFDSVTGKQTTDALITFNPMMDMGTMEHSCPHKNPEGNTDADTKAFVGMAVFIMPSTAGTWTFNILVHNVLTGLDGIAALPVTVVEKVESRLISFISKTDSAKLL